LKKDLLHVRFDPKKVTPQLLQETVSKQGFEARLVPAGK
jgi:hypothetical protein